LARVLPHKSKYFLYHSLRRMLGIMPSANLQRPIYIFTHHKVSTVLMSNVFRKISNDLGLKYCKVYGHCEEAPSNADIVLFEHGLVSQSVLDSEFIGVHIRRDPRDIVVSGYLYHRHTTEEWCTNVPDVSQETVSSPQVDYSIEHMSKEWKGSFIASLDGMSYQQKLLRLNKSDGINFEIDNYASWTIDALQAWDYTNPKVMELKMEDISENFENIFLELFEFLGFSGSAMKQCMQRAREQNINSMSEKQIQKNKHIHGGSLSKWKKHFSEENESYFNQRFAGVVELLGYK
jgi:hypothetical protein